MLGVAKANKDFQSIRRQFLSTPYVASLMDHDHHILPLIQWNRLIDAAICRNEYCTALPREVIIVCCRANDSIIAK